VHTPTLLLLLAAAAVGVVHASLPDHWAPIAVVARTQRWTLARTARTSALAAGGHIVASLALGGVIALVGLQFQHQVENQQAHIVGVVLVLTGLGFLAWGLSGHGHVHEDRWQGAQDSDHDQSDEQEHESHQHEHPIGVTVSPHDSHTHEHAHAGRRHSHRHNHEAFIHARADLIAKRTAEQSLVGGLTAIIVPFGVAASPDLTFLPVAAAASAYGASVVAASLAVFALFTMAAFVSLTVIATAAGYQMKGEWLEHHANTVTSVLLIAVGIFVFVGF
jgi:nickel/cobalt exporter